MLTTTLYTEKFILNVVYKIIASINKRRNPTLLIIRHFYPVLILYILLSYSMIGDLLCYHPTYAVRPVGYSYLFYAYHFGIISLFRNS